MEKIRLAIVAQRATKYNKVVRKIARGENSSSGSLEVAETALEKALNNVANIGYIGIIWIGELIDKIIVGDNLIEIG